MMVSLAAPRTLAQTEAPRVYSVSLPLIHLKAVLTGAFPSPVYCVKLDMYSASSSSLNHYDITIQHPLSIVMIQLQYNILSQSL